MKQILTILAVATLLVGCRSSQEKGGMGGTGTEPVYDNGSATNSIDNRSNLPGGDVRQNLDGESSHGITP